MSSISNSTNLALIRSALPYIPSDDRDVWIRTGMAIKSAFADSGFAIWDQWSRTSDRYNEQDARAAWKSFKPGGGITIGTIIYLARQNGWQFSGTQIRHAKKAPHQTKPQRKGTSLRNDLRIRKALRGVWHRSMPITDPRAELARIYLKKRLGGDLDPLPNDLRYSEALNYWEDGHYVGEFPAMLGVVRDPNDQLVTLHRTYLKSDGSGKAPVSHPKKLMSCRDGTTVTGAAIRLYRPGESLALAEGIESALAFHVLHSIPVWACISAHGVENVEVPSTVRHLILAGDKDRNFAGQRAALALLARLAARNITVELKLPSNLGMDWCDALVSQSCQVTA